MLFRSEREKKMVVHEKFMEKKVSENEKKLSILTMSHDRREGEQLMYALRDGEIKIEELDLRIIDLLDSHVEIMLARIARQSADRE